MSLKRLFYLIFSINILLLISIGLLTLALFKVESALAESQEKRLVSIKLADELRQSSDDLTRFARTNVVTGDELYQTIFNDILAIRNGEKPRPENYDRIYWDLIVFPSDRKEDFGQKISLHSKMIDAGFTEEEFDKLKKAQINSDKLVKLENIAKNAAKGIFLDQKGNFTIHGKPNRAYAISIMHGIDYHLHKREIMQPINEFLKLIENRTNESVRKFESYILYLLTTMFAIITILILSLLFSYKVIHGKVSLPIYGLIDAATEIGNQNWNTSISYESNDEIGHLARAFRVLKNKISILIQDLNNSNQNLSKTNLDLMKALEELKAAEAQLIQSEKMSALGQLVAGIAHEINTPLGSIRTSISNFDEAVTFVLSFPTAKLSDNASIIFKDLIKDRQEFSQSNQTTRERRTIKKDVEELLQKAKIKNPEYFADLLLDINKNKPIEPLISILQEEGGENTIEYIYKISRLRGNIRNISQSVDRASKIVYALKNYSHQDLLGKKIEINLTENIETVLTIYNSLLRDGVEVIKNFNYDGPIHCFPDEISQVWTNLIHNAVQAIEGQGSIYIETNKEIETNMANIIIRDTGKGIKEEDKARIFDPFFTTKIRGEGTGLGLGIVKKIIEKHKGEIYFQSDVAVGTTFTVRLPL
ncbi:GHKL domain-containing protein [Leptospira sp. 201903075]|uniref:ATP-binding protein n=1 Tax=Leptospira chreensis TaxID=2810035 RepID=UPI00196592CD|nr:ATP-binding protein [Leptospira chreensis]MBM9592268.1 GHKL domain-containing protein [Leptospira chreensis]